MQIKFDLKFRDYFLFNIAHNFFLVPYQILTLGFSVLMNWDKLVAGNLLVGIIGVVTIYLEYWAGISIISLILAISSKDKALLTGYTVEIQEEAFYVETRFEKSSRFWQGISRIAVRPEFVAVYTNSRAAYIVPNRAFSGPKMHADFLMLLRKRLEVATAK